MDKEKLTEIFSNKEFVKSFFEPKNEEEVQKVLKEKGIDLSLQEIQKIREILIQKKNGELSDEELEAVSGGGFGDSFLKCLQVAQVISDLIEGISGIGEVIGAFF